MLFSRLSSLLSIVSDDDISVGFYPLRAFLVGERIVQFLYFRFKASPAVDTEDDRGRSIRKAMAEIVIMLVFLLYLFFNVVSTFVNGLPPLLSILCKGLPVVYGDVAFRCRLTTSLYRSHCPPRRRFPLVNSP